MDPDLKDLIAYLRVRHRTLRCGPLARTALLFEHITDPEMLRNPHFVGAREIFGDLIEVVARHSDREEQVVFPLVEALAGKSDQRAGVRLETTIDALLGEHQHIRNLLRKLESHRATFLCERHEGCRALVEKLGHVDRHLRECMALEDNVLFPRAIGARENSYAGTLAGTGA